MGFFGGVKNVAKTAGRLYTLGVFDKKNVPGQAGYDPAREEAIKKRFADLQVKLDATGKPQMLTPETKAYEARSTTPEIESQLANQKASISRQYNAGAQSANDAVSRRFAAMGAGGSGSAVKASERIFQDAADKSVQAQNELESATRAQFGEQEANRAFQSNEAMKGRNAAREQFNSEVDFKDKVFRFDSTSKLAQLELGFIQSERDAQDQNFNKEMARYQQANQGGLLGGGGILGTGFSL